jgi:hypothetical protein
VLTTEALVAAAPLRRFVAAHAASIAMVGLSDPFRPARGGMIAQARAALERSGPWLLPFLATDLVLPRLVGRLPRRPDQAPAATPLLRLCARLGICAETVVDMNAVTFRDRLAASRADAILTFQCDQILSAATLAVLPRGGFNVHAGLLPQQRGPMPTVHALRDDPPRFGVTIHRLVPCIQAGAILAQAPMELPKGISALEAALFLHEAAVPLLAETLDRLADGTAVDYAVEPGPYRRAPTRAELREVARAGGRLVRWRDVGRALQTPI